jgi:hypothetical protein
MPAARVRKRNLTAYVGKPHRKAKWDYGAKASRCLGRQAFLYVSK